MRAVRAVAGIASLSLLIGHPIGPAQNHPGVVYATEGPSVSGPAAPTTIAIVNAKVLPMSGDEAGLLRRHTVLLEDGRIRAIGRSSQIEIPGDAAIVDARGRYLLPGLADLHVHLWYPGITPTVTPQDMWDLLLTAGVTTVFDMGAVNGIIGWRDQLELGITTGPRLLSSSVGVSNNSYPTPDAVEAAVRQAAANGHDAIKAYNPLERPSYARLLATAAEVGIRVVGHTPRRGHTMGDVVDGGQDLIAHAQEILVTQFDPTGTGRHPFERLDEADAVGRRMRNGDVWLQATLEIFDLIGRLVDDDEYAALQQAAWLRYVPAALQARWDRSAESNYRRAGGNWSNPEWWRERTEFQRQLVRRLWQAGTPMVIGTDAGGIDYALLGRTIHDEMAQLSRAGIPAYAVLQMATVNAERYLGTDATRGTIEVGKAPDLILVKGNPLRNLKRLARVEGVLIGGRWLDKDDLRARLDRLVSKYGR